VRLALLSWLERRAMRLWSWLHEAWAAEWRRAVVRDVRRAGRRARDRDSRYISEKQMGGGTQ
jgi:hypothetical protein